MNITSSIAAQSPGWKSKTFHNKRAADYSVGAQCVAYMGWPDTAAEEEEEEEEEEGERGSVGLSWRRKRPLGRLKNGLQLQPLWIVPTAAVGRSE